VIWSSMFYWPFFPPCITGLYGKPETLNHGGHRGAQRRLSRAIFPLKLLCDLRGNSRVTRTAWSNTLERGQTEEAEENGWQAEFTPAPLPLSLPPRASVVRAVMVSREFSRGIRSERRTDARQLRIVKPPLPPLLRVSKALAVPSQASHSEVFSRPTEVGSAVKPATQSP
jgi:hypothetical protein